MALLLPTHQRIVALQSGSALRYQQSVLRCSSFHGHRIHREYRGRSAESSFRRHVGWIVRAQQGDGDLDVAVFRFTLGIPGFDDSKIPQVVGAAVAALVVVNNVFGSQPTPPPQVRAEFLTIMLAVLCFTAPEIEARLREASSSRGRQAAGSLAGSAQVFALDANLDQATKTELAWMSRSLLVNANCCTVAVVKGATAAMARGAVASEAQVAAAAGTSTASAAAGGNQAVLDSIGQCLQQPSQRVAAVASGQQQQQLWCPDRSAMAAAGVDKWTWLPQGVQAMLLLHLPLGKEGGLLVVASDRERGLSDKDLKWVSAMAQKLAGAASSETGKWNEDTL